MQFRQLLVKLALLSLLILGFSAILYPMEQLPVRITSFFPFVVFYFFILSAIQFHRVIKIKTDDIRVFHTKYTAWFGIKLFLNIAVVLLFVLANKVAAKEFLIYFIALYIIYTVFDAYNLSKLVKSKV